MPCGLPVLLQLLSFPLSPVPQLHWRTSVLSTLSKVLSTIALSSDATFARSGSALTFFTLACTWQLCVLINAAWIGKCYTEEAFPVVWPIKVVPRR